MKVINLVTNAHQRPSSKICAILKNSFMFGAIQCGKGGISHYLSNFLLPILETWTDSLHFCWVVCEINALNILLVQNFRNVVDWVIFGHIFFPPRNNFLNTHQRWVSYQHIPVFNISFLEVVSQIKNGSTNTHMMSYFTRT